MHISNTSDEYQTLSSHLVTVLLHRRYFNIPTAPS